ncbi:MAG TPA: helix-turn-helix domain-containing protein [Solirubrobacterales bacterium]|nr:helix-turn-helix domain-containing protein [Solirubrobacterales bacterium]
MAPLDRPIEEDLLTALGHPLRREILRAMADGKPASPRELADALRQPLSNVSYHVRVLVQSKAVTLVRTKPTRGSIQHFYRSTVQAPWAREVLKLGEIDSEGAGENQGGAST